MPLRMSLQFIFRGGRNMKCNWNYWNRMMSSSATVTEPWLMLAPPKLSAEAYGHKFYSLGEKKVISTKKEGRPPAWAQGRVIHLGCTRGWMASFNEDGYQSFLSNPITGLHIRLPALPASTWPESIILTASPDAHDCRAIITYRHNCSIAVCFPAHKTTWWLPMCNQLHYLDLAYSTRHKRLFCLTLDSVECWDLESPSSFVWKVPLFDDSASEEDDDDTGFRFKFSYPKYLVMDEHSGRLFLVIRDVLGHIGRDGSYMKSIYSHGNDYPYKTLSFDVYEIDANKGTLSYMEGSLDGLAMFVGASHSFAMPAADLNLTPDSIYFVHDFDQLHYCVDEDGEIKHGSYDIGIFNYVDTKLSSIYYPSHPSQISGIAPTFWFTPVPH